MRTPGGIESTKQKHPLVMLPPTTRERERESDIIIIIIITVSRNKRKRTNERTPCCCHRSREKERKKEIESMPIVCQHPVVSDRSSSAFFFNFKI
mmetsp:Transcript_18549/g.42834  ORF Transcript_18549/g.42834 Transcript_18549/m.42834 type:complete len:95 (-) Transcript_18549:25-309(-)